MKKGEKRREKFDKTKNHQKLEAKIMFAAPVVRAKSKDESFDF